MILGRCNYHLKRWKTHLIRSGIPWHNPYRATKDWNPADTKTWQAVKSYDRIRQGMEVPGEDIREMIAKMNTGYLVKGVKTNRKKLIDDTIGPAKRGDVFFLSGSGWFQSSFFNFNDHITRIFTLTGSSGELIANHGAEITRKEPQVVLGTYHSVKGGEADHVWLDQSTSPNIARAVIESRKSWADEIRVAYVGVTRARNTVGLLQPNGGALSIWV